MEQDLAYLESRVGALVERLTEVGSQNTKLAEALAHALKQNAELTFRLEHVKTRVAALIERLPADEDEAV
jgi:DNA-binding SARP family transcriptional activator